jgi:subtilase family serine protease
LTIQNAVKNQGTATAGTSEISFYLSTDQTLSTASDTFVCKRSIASLTAGASNPTSGTTSTVCTLPAVPAGSYYVIGYADSAGVVVEARENNNTQTGALITVP